MYLQNIISRKKLVFCWRLEGQGRKYQDPDLNPLVRGTDPQIRNRVRIRTKMSQIHNNGKYYRWHQILFHLIGAIVKYFFTSKNELWLNTVCCKKTRTRICKHL
jgi:hypothetical protein